MCGAGRGAPGARMPVQVADLLSSLSCRGGAVHGRCGQGSSRSSEARPGCQSSFFSHAVAE
eukprot:650057-Alexandrium_andersonii.AAC.1